MTVRTRVPLRRLVVLSLGVAFLGGCIASGGEKPAPSGTPAATSEATTEPSPSPTEVPPYDGTAAPQMPADMASDGHLGARAAATYLFEVRNWAILSGDVAGLEAFCDPASIFCSQIKQAIGDDVANGVVSTGGLVDFEIDEVLPPSTEYAFFEVRGILNQEPIVRSDSAGAVIETTVGAQELPFVVYVEHREPSGWIVRGADIHQP